MTNNIMALADALAEYRDHSEYVHSRAALLAEVDALVAENEKLRKALLVWARVDELGRLPDLHRESWQELVENRNTIHRAALGETKS